MSELNNNNVFEQNNPLQPLIDMIDSIMSIPEDQLNGPMISAMNTYINEAFTPEVKLKALTQTLDTFTAQGMSREQARAAVKQEQDAIQSAIDDINPSEKHRQLLSTALNPMFEILDQAVNQYKNNNISVNVMLDEGAKAPTYAHDTDAAADLYARADVVVPANSQSNLIDTGVHISLPPDWAAIVIPRSSIGLKTGLRLSNSVGLIDQDYRGSIGVIYDNISNSDYTIHAGDRIAQLMLVPVHRLVANVVEQLDSTEREEGGFGSTGK